MRRRTVWINAVATAALLSGAAAPEPRANDDSDFCSETARLLFQACGAQVTDDSFVQEAICINISNRVERERCLTDLEDARREGNQLCQDQRDGRLSACESLGEDRYDPDFHPALFDNPKTPTNPNVYFPLKVGYRWKFKSGTQVDTVEVVNETKLIAGVTCIVVRDQVKEDGDLIEATDDWYAQAKNGNTWYCGEEVKDYESFDGDKPRKPELVSIDGSFKAGREGDKPGIIFLASPKEGDVYLEEASLANAEDVTEVLSTTYRFGDDRGLDHLVPEQLARRLCPGDCVVTKNFSLLEPGLFARKYYARGIGVFLEVESTGEVVQLVNCNIDDRCKNLPQP